MENNNIIIGLTGRFGAGCTVTSKYFTNTHNFPYFSISALLVEKAKREIRNFDTKDPKEKREILQDLGDSLRKKDKAILVSHIIEEIKEKKLKNAVVECFRNPAEIEAFKNAFGDRFFLLAIDAEIEKRRNRLKKIYKNDEDLFDRDDRRDSGHKQPDFGQQVKRCIELADILLNNEDDFYHPDGTKNRKAIDCYAQKLSDYLNLMLQPGIRAPYPNELYMQHACSVSLRSRCSQRQVGAVIVRELPINFNISDEKFKGYEDYVVATGCNNVPSGEEDCKVMLVELGDTITICYRDHVKRKYFDKYIYCKECGTKIVDRKSFICNKCEHDNKKLPGKLLSVCRAVHAEEAAIIQAARLGSTALNGAKLYSSTFPCMLCCKKIINTGIKKVVYLESYPMEESLAIQMFRKCNVEISKYEGVNTLAFIRLFKKNL